MGGSSFQQLLQRPLYIHTMADAGHAQFGEVLLGEGGEVRALDLVLLEALAVLGQVDAGQPVGHVVLVPQVKGLLVEGSQGEERRADGRVRGRRRATPGAGAPHDEAHLLGLMRQTEARRFQDGRGRGGRGSQAEASDGSERVRAVRGRGAGAGSPAADRVTTARTDGKGGTVASLRDGMKLA